MRGTSKVRSAPARAGFSIIEVAISLTILSSLIAGLVMMATEESRGVRTVERDRERGLRRQSHGGSNRRQVARGRGRDPPPDPRPQFATDRIAFRSIVSNQAGDVGWGPTSRFVLAPEPGEGDDGLDNDGDGLIDERRIVFFEDIDQPDPQAVVICHDVPVMFEGELLNGEDDNGNGLIDESGLCFSLDGDILTVRLSVEVAIRPGETLVRSSEQSLRLRN